MRGFYWLIDGVLAGCSQPGGWSREDRSARLDADLDWLRERGIGAVLSLTETALPAATLDRHGLTSLHLPVEDLRAPSPSQMLAALAFVDRARVRGQGVVIHCRVGQGRTGTILAAYLVRGGLDAATALREVRAVCPGAVGSPEQEIALEAFARDREWIV